MPVDPDVSLAWTEIAQGSRHCQHMLENVPSPAEDSDFDRARRFYPFEPVHDRARAYLDAALEHLVLWADVVAPFKFHPDHEVTSQQRPPYTLARAAMEAAAQAVWMLDTAEPRECIRRHLSLIRWDLQEHKKSKLDLEEKRAVQGVEDDLVRRVSEVFTGVEIRPPAGYLWVVRQACAADGVDVDADEAERLWRAASGSAHGMYWPTRDLRQLVEVESEPGRPRQVRVANAWQMTAVLRAAYDITRCGVFRYALFAGADLPALIQSSSRWLAGMITVREDADPAVLARLRGTDATADPSA